jgi:hypothetical protein
MSELLKREKMARALFEVGAPPHQFWDDVGLDKRELYLCMADAALSQGSSTGAPQAPAPDGERMITVPYNPCLEKLRPGEPFFVLLGRDKQAPESVLCWANARERAEGKTAWTEQAREVVQEMVAYSGAPPARSAAMTDDEAMRRLSANEVACYRWPDDTSEHKALRAAFMDGAASAAPTTSPEPPFDLAAFQREAETWETVESEQSSHSEIPNHLNCSKSSNGSPEPDAVRTSGKALVKQLRSTMHRLNGQAYSSLLSQLNEFEAVLSRPAHGGWQDISTAPKEPQPLPNDYRGPDILLNLGTYADVGSWFRHSARGDDGWWTCHTMPVKPIGWMPVPDLTIARNERQTGGPRS